MTSLFNPGTGSDLVSTNKPGALWELVQLLAKAELDLPADTRPNSITVSIDMEAKVANVAATLPIGFVIDSTSGRMVVTVNNYAAASFDPGSGGDLKSNQVPGALLEVFQIVSAAEQAVPGDNKPNNVSGTFDLDAGTATLTMALPITTVIGPGGNIQIAAVDYL